MKALAGPTLERYIAERRKLETKIKAIENELGPLQEEVSKINRSL